MTYEMKKDGIKYEMGGVGIGEVDAGDVVKVSSGRLERITGVSNRYDRSGNWIVSTESGTSYTGRQILAYGTKSDES